MVPLNIAIFVAFLLYYVHKFAILEFIKVNAVEPVVKTACV